MKKNLLLLIVALFLASCTKTELSNEIDYPKEQKQSYSDLLMSDKDKIVEIASHLSDASKAYVKDGINMRTGQEDLSEEDTKVLIEATLNTDFEATLNDDILGFGILEKQIQIERNPDGLANGNDIVAKYNQLNTEVADDLGTTKQLFFGDIELESTTAEHFTYKVFIKTLNEDEGVLELFGDCTINDTDYWSPWNSGPTYDGGKCGPYAGDDSDFGGGPHRAQDLLNNPCSLLTCADGGSLKLVNWLAVEGIPFGPNDSALGSLVWCNDLCLDPTQMNEAVSILFDIKSELLPVDPTEEGSSWIFTSCYVNNDGYICNGDLWATYWHGFMQYGVFYCSGGNEN